MITKELLEFTKQQMALGKSKEEIKNALIGQGWHEADIEETLASVSPSAPVVADTHFPTGQLPRAKEIFSEAWKIYRARFKTLIAINVIPVLAFVLAAVVFSGGGWLAFYLNKVFHISLVGFGIAGVLVGLIAAVLLIYLGVWGTVAELVAIKDHGEAIGWKESYRRSRNKMKSFFSSNLLSGLAVVGGMILFVIPGIIFALWFSQVSYVVIEENLKNTAALKQSKSYVKGRLRKVFGKLFYMVFITIVVYLVFGVLVGLIYKAFGVNIASNNTNNSNTSWPTNLLSIFWTPLVTCYGYVLYKALRNSASPQ
jgi:hypothetical protein